MKTALITGATDGIGKATAKKLLQEGWKVVIVGRNPAKCETTVSELKTATNNNEISAIVADLSSMIDAKNACEKFLAENNSLNLLLLNANAIANEKIITSEGFEENFALGYLSRVLMIKKLKNILTNTPNSQILSVVGISFSRLDFNDLTIENKFTGWKGLTRWQWSMVVFVSEFNKDNEIPLNLFTPGLVKTKILANEPQPMRTFVKIANIFMGISVEKSANELFVVVNQIVRNKTKNEFFMRTKQKNFPKVEMQPNDQKNLWELTDNLLNKYL